jgi:hypothetical protein
MLQEVGAEDAVGDRGRERQPGRVTDQAARRRAEPGGQLLDVPVERRDDRAAAPELPGVPARSAAEVEDPLAAKRAVPRLQVVDGLRSQERVEGLGVLALVPPEAPQGGDPSQPPRPLLGQ